MNRWIISGLLLNAVYAVMLAVIAIGTPALQIAVGVCFIAQVVGGLLVATGRFEAGAWTTLIAGAPFLPVGALLMFGGWKLREAIHNGEVSDEHVDATLPPRPWQLATAGFGLSAIGAFGLAIAWMQQDLTESLLLLQVLVAVLIGLAAAVVAVSIWRQEENAYRQGLNLCVVSFIAALISAFYLHSYLALSLLVWPLYLALLLYQGRSRWDGFEQLREER